MCMSVPISPVITTQTTRDFSPSRPIPAKNTVARRELMRMMQKVDALESAASLQNNSIDPPVTPRATLSDRQFHTPTKASDSDKESLDGDSVPSERCLSVDSSPQAVCHAKPSLSFADESVEEEEEDDVENSVDKSFDEDDFDSSEFTIHSALSKDPFKKVAPPAAQKAKPKCSPVQAFVERVSKTTPEKPLCSFSPMSRDLANRAIASAKERPVAMREEAWKRLHSASIDGLQRSSIAKVLNFSNPADESQVVLVENLSEMKDFWSGELLQIVARHSTRNVPGRYTLDVTHLEKLESGKGMHYHDSYFNGSWIHSGSKVWCARLNVSAEKENEENGYKYSTLFPISYKSQAERAALVSKALSDPSYEIARDKKLSLYQIPDCPFAFEIVKCEGIIITVIPVMEYIVFNAETSTNKMLSYDLYTDGGVRTGAYTATLSKILPDIREGLKQKTLKVRYTGQDFIIVDVASLLNDCPIEKGILVQFSKLIGI